MSVEDSSVEDDYSVQDDSSGKDDSSSQDDSSSHDDSSSRDDSSIFDVPELPVTPPTPPPTQRPAPKPVRTQLRSAHRPRAPSTTPTRRAPPRTSSQEGPNMIVSSVQHPRQSLAYVSVPPRVLKRPPPSSNTPDGISNLGSDGNSGRSHHIGEERPQFLCDATQYFSSIPGGDNWKELLSEYVKFEKLAPLVSFSCSRPSSSRLTDILDE